MSLLPLKLTAKSAPLETCSQIYPGVMLDSSYQFDNQTEGADKARDFEKRYDIFKSAKTNSRKSIGREVDQPEAKTLG